MTEKEIKYKNIDDYNLRELGYSNELTLENCFIIDDDYSFKWWQENGEFHYSVSKLYDNIYYHDLFELRMELGFVAQKIASWFKKDWEYNWDTYLPNYSYGRISFEPYDNKKIKIILSNSFYRQ